tara:strand:- start:4301 stop:4951 length:651 start_codon:yes stop_codon:yes gene_type:complete
MVEPVTAVLTGIALVKQATSFIKDNINTVNDISGIAKQIDQMFEGQQQINKERSKQANSTANELGLSNVADSIINAKLAQERIAEIRTLINYRFPVSNGPSTWDQILLERKRRIEERKQAIQKAKAKKLKQQKEMYDMIRMGFIVLAVIAFIAVAVGITVKIVLAHTILNQNDQSCRIFEPKYFLVCMSEGKDAALIEFELDQKKNRGNWIVDDDE